MFPNKLTSANYTQFITVSTSCQEDNLIVNKVSYSKKTIRLDSYQAGHLYLSLSFFSILI